MVPSGSVTKIAVRGKLEDVVETLCRVPCSLLRGPLLGHIANKTQHYRPRGRCRRLQQNIDRKLASILAQSEQIQSDPHLTRLGVGKIILPMVGMAVPKTLGNQAVNRQAFKLFLRIAEQFPGPRVRVADSSLLVGDDNPVRRKLEEVLEALGSLLPGPLLGHIAHKTHHHGTGCCLHWLEMDVGRKFGSIFAQPVHLRLQAHLAIGGEDIVVFAMVWDGASGSARGPGSQRICRTAHPGSSQTALQRSGSLRGSLRRYR